MSEPIQRPEDALLFYRFPSAPPPGTQVEVARDEHLVVLRNGALLGTVGAGTHALDPRSLPFLAGNASELELWIVSTSAVDGVQAGGPLGMVIDVSTKVRCEPKVQLSYALAVIDPAKFVLGCNGANINEVERLFPWVGTQLVGGLRDRFVQLVERDRLSVTSPQIIGQLIESAGTLVPKLESLGLKIAGINELEVSFSDRDKAALREVKTTASTPVAQAVLRCSKCGKTQAKGKFCADCGGALQG